MDYNSLRTAFKFQYQDISQGIKVYGWHIVLVRDFMAAYEKYHSLHKIFWILCHNFPLKRNRDAYVSRVFGLEEEFLKLKGKRIILCNSNRLFEVQKHTTTVLDGKIEPGTNVTIKEINLQALSEYIIDKIPIKYIPLPQSIIEEKKILVPYQPDELVRYKENMEIVEKIKEHVNIVDHIKKDTNLKKVHDYYIGLCPLHEDHEPSFFINEKKQFFNCFGCLKAGDIVEYEMLRYNINFVQAVENLCSEYGINNHFQDKFRTFFDANKSFVKNCYQILKTSPKAIEWLKKRGVKGEAAKKYQIGYFDFERIIVKQPIFGFEPQEFIDRYDKRVIFPIVNKFGVVAIAGAAIDGSKPKYINTRGTEIFTKGCEFFGINHIKDQVVRIVEGYLDTITMSQKGYNAIATMGCATTIAHVLPLQEKKIRKVILCFDGDNAGIEATIRAFQIFIPFFEVEAILYPWGEDPDSYYNGERKEKEKYLTQPDLIKWVLEECSKKNYKKKDFVVKYMEIYSKLKDGS